MDIPLVTLILLLFKIFAVLGVESSDIESSSEEIIKKLQEDVVSLLLKVSRSISNTKLPNRMLLEDSAERHRILRQQWPNYRDRLMVS